MSHMNLLLFTREVTITEEMLVIDEPEHVAYVHASQVL